MLAVILVALQTCASLHVRLSPSFFARGVWENDRIELFQYIEHHPSQEMMELLVSQPPWLRHSFDMPLSIPWKKYMGAVHEWCLVPGPSWALYDKIVTGEIATEEEMASHVQATLCHEQDLQAMFDRAQRTCIRVSHGIIPTMFWHDLGTRLAQEENQANLSESKAANVAIDDTDERPPGYSDEDKENIDPHVQRAYSAPYVFASPRPTNLGISSMEDGLLLKQATPDTSEEHKIVEAQHVSHQNTSVLRTSSESDDSIRMTHTLRSFGYEISDQFLQDVASPELRAKHSEMSRRTLAAFSSERAQYRSARGSLSCHYPKRGRDAITMTRKPTLKAIPKPKNLLYAMSSLWADFEPDVYKFNSLNLSVFPDAMAHSIRHRIMSSPATCLSLYCASIANLVYLTNTSSLGLSSIPDNTMAHDHWMFVPLSVAANDCPLQAKMVFKYMDANSMDIFNSDTVAGRKISEAGTVLLTLSTMAFRRQTQGPSHAERISKYPAGVINRAYESLIWSEHMARFEMGSEPSSPRMGLGRHTRGMSDDDLSSLEDSPYGNAEPMITSPSPLFHPPGEQQSPIGHRPAHGLHTDGLGERQSLWESENHVWMEHMRLVRNIPRRSEWQSVHRQSSNLTVWQEWSEVLPTTSVPNTNFNDDVSIVLEKQSLPEAPKDFNILHGLSNAPLTGGTRDEWRAKHTPLEAFPGSSDRDEPTLSTKIEFAYEQLYASSTLSISDKITVLTKNIIVTLFELVKHEELRNVPEKEALESLQSWILRLGVSIDDLDDRMHNFTEDQEELCTDLEFTYIATLTMRRNQMNAVIDTVHDTCPKHLAGEVDLHDTGNSGQDSISGLRVITQDFTVTVTKEEGQFQPNELSTESVDHKSQMSTTVSSSELATMWDILATTNIESMYLDISVCLFSNTARISGAIYRALHTQSDQAQASIESNADNRSSAECQSHPDFDLAVKCYSRYMSSSDSEKWTCTALMRVAKELLSSVDEFLHDRSTEIRASWMLQSISAVIACAESSMANSSPVVEELALLALGWPSLSFANVAPALLVNFASSMNGHHDRYISQSHGRLTVHPEPTTWAAQNLRILDNAVPSILKFAPDATQTLIKWHIQQPIQLILSPLELFESMWTGPCVVFEAWDLINLPALSVDIRKSFSPVLPRPVGVAIELPTGKGLELEFYVVVCTTVAELSTAGIAAVAAKMLQPTHGCVDTLKRPASVFQKKNTQSKFSLIEIKNWTDCAADKLPNKNPLRSNIPFCHKHWGCAATVHHPVSLPMIQFRASSHVVYGTWTDRALETLSRLLEISLMLTMHIHLPLELSMWRSLESQCMLLRSRMSYYTRPLLETRQHPSIKLANTLCADFLYSVSVDHLVASKALTVD